MNIRGSGWQADCPQCVASKFTCDKHYVPDVECTRCDGNGWIEVRRHGILRGLHQEDCPDCCGHGWRPMTQDEIDDAAADAFSDMCEGEPPVTMAEQYQRAAEEKRRLS